MKKALEIFKNKSTLVMLVISVLSCIYFITRTINQKTELQTYKARCDLAEQALRHPKTVTDMETITITETEYIDMTEQEQQEICEQYDMRMEYLKQIIKYLRKTTTIVTEVISEKSEAIIPQEPPALSNRKWSIGILGINAKGEYTFGIAANRDIGRAFEINAGISPMVYYAGLLYKF